MREESVDEAGDTILEGGGVVAGTWPECIREPRASGPNEENRMSVRQLRYAHVPLPTSRRPEE